MGDEITIDWWIESLLIHILHIKCFAHMHAYAYGIRLQLFTAVQVEWSVNYNRYSLALIRQSNIVLGFMECTGAATSLGQKSPSKASLQAAINMFERNTSF